MIATSEHLRRVGYGSFSWFEAVFNHEIELKKILGILAENLGALPAIRYFERQVLSFVTEWGAGEEALTIQPATEYTISRDQHGAIQVFAVSHPEIGEQLAGYLQFESMPPPIRDSLRSAFALLYDLNPGESLVIFSPTEFYQEQESKSDVNNLITVTGKSSNGEIQAKGWFLFPNRKLTNEERKHWLELHTMEPVTEQDLEPKNIVKKPHLWQSQSNDPDETAKEYIAWINDAFISLFGYPLYKKNINQETELFRELHGRVSKNINQLYEELLHSPAARFYKKMWQLLQNGQQLWAEMNDIDFVGYWAHVLAGQKQILGFHPTDGSNLIDYWDPVAGDWIGGTHNCGSETTTTGYCKIHGDYTGSHCPKCPPPID